MKWMKICSAVVMTFGLTTAAQADMFDLFHGWNTDGSSKCCGCAPCCQPCCCKPVIVRPCCPTVHCYQRQCACAKPACCNRCCEAPKCCAPAPCCAPKCCPAPTCGCPATACAPKCCEAPHCCAPAPCCAPKCCAPAPTCCPAPTCNNCCPTENCCPRPGLLASLFGGHAKGVCYETHCTTVKVCCADPCEVANLIYESQTCCYGRQRAKAVHKLGAFDCQCNPEILCAMVYALNDADEHVRREAAEEIGVSLHRNPCCCSKEVVAALTCALADCDRHVRHHAEKALRQCGYEVVDGCCKPSCCGPVGCASGCASAPMNAAPAPAGPTPAPSMAPAPTPAPAPAPAPPEDTKAYFPTRLRDAQTQNAPSSSTGLSGLFGMNN